jgi:hypothetical protein
MSSSDKNRLRKTYSFFRPQPVFASGGGGGGGGGGICEQFWYSTTNDSIYTTGSVAIRGGDTTLDDPADKGTDVFFYVSGSSFTATDFSLFGGDVFVSGSVISLGDLIEVTGSIIATEGISGSLTTLSDGTSYLIAGPNITILSQSNGSISISGSAPVTFRFLAGTVASGQPSGSMQSVGMDYFDKSMIVGSNKSYIFKAILAKTAGTTAYMDLYDYDGIIGGTPGPISGAVLTGSSESYTYLTADLTSAFATATTSGIIEARIWCDPTGAGLNAICKNAKLEII